MSQLKRYNQGLGGFGLMEQCNNGKWTEAELACTVITQLEASLESVSEENEKLKKRDEVLGMAFDETVDKVVELQNRVYDLKRSLLRKDFNLIMAYVGLAAVITIAIGIYLVNH